MLRFSLLLFFAVTLGGTAALDRPLSAEDGAGQPDTFLVQFGNKAIAKLTDPNISDEDQIARFRELLYAGFDVPVLALSQLSRAVEQREDKRPQLADLRESGSIEQDADVVMFIYREQYYHERAEPQQRVDESDEKYAERMLRYQDAEVIIAKQRHGPIGTVKMYFDGHATKFADWVDPDHLPDAGG